MGRRGTYASRSGRDQEKQRGQECDYRPYEESAGGGVVQEARLAIRRSNPQGRRDFFRGSGKPAPTRLPPHRTTHPWRANSLPPLQNGARQEPDMRSRLPRTLWDSPSRRERAYIEQTLGLEWRRRKLCEWFGRLCQNAGNSKTLRIKVESDPSYARLDTFSDYFLRTELLRTVFTKSGSFRR